MYIYIYIPILHYIVYISDIYCASAYKLLSCSVVGAERTRGMKSERRPPTSE